MLNIDRIRRKRDVNPEQENRNTCLASTLARGLWQLMSGVVIVHLLGTVLLASLFVVTNVQVERLDRALEALNGSAKQIYTLVLTLATPITIYSAKTAKSSKEQ
jgi:hypothetical protein